MTGVVWREQGRENRFHDRIHFQVEAAAATMSPTYVDEDGHGVVIRSVDDIDMSADHSETFESASEYHPYAFRWVKSRLQP